MGAVVSKSIFRTEAAKRWPSHTIEGDGGIAVVLACCNKVVLNTLVRAAQSLAADRCGGDCMHRIAPEHHWHRIVMVKLPTPPRPRRWPSMERD